MIKTIKILFVILAITSSCTGQTSDIFEKIKLKLNDKKSTDHSALLNKSLQYPKKDIQYSFLENNKGKFISGKSITKINTEIDPSLNKRYPVWVPISEVIGINFGLGAFNTYVSKSGYAKISFKTIQKNFQTSFVWDHDHFITNFFAHPFHGNLYFNTARSTGYTFWESVPFAFGGSLMWELFMENEPPATNDLINTTVSGYFLGETLYRLSSLVIDESKTGFERVYREIFAGILNPAREFNRILTGKVSRVTSKKGYVVQPIYLEATFGSNRVLQGQNFFSGIITGAINLKMIYGDPFKEEKRIPFDFIRVKAQFNTGAKDSTTSFIGIVTAYGILAGKTLNVKKQKVLAGLFQHYDFFDNSIYKFGGISFGAGLITEFPTSLKETSILSSLHLNFMPLGAANSEYSAFGEKEYNFSTGFNMIFESGVQLSWGLIGVSYNLYWLHTVIGTASNEFVGLLKPRLEVNIVKHINIGTEFTLYHREGFYRDYPDVHLRNNEVQFYVGYTFDNLGFLKKNIGL